MLCKFGVVGADTGAAEFKNDGVMHEAIDGRRGGHGILEDAVPFAKDEVAGDDNAAALITLGEKRKQDLQ